MEESIQIQKDSQNAVLERNTYIVMPVLLVAGIVAYIYGGGPEGVTMLIMSVVMAFGFPAVIRMLIRYNRPTSVMMSEEGITLSFDGKKPDTFLAWDDIRNVRVMPQMMTQKGKRPSAASVNLFEGKQYRMDAIAAMQIVNFRGRLIGAPIELSEDTNHIKEWSISRGTI